ncbi:hypothetical protein BDN72DRAFT_845810 [Pluteus cervinus]|uniref:Uncharacterized protein n=1 Tax=Pluteus cervinus TaxID=181527 RepID=A0ACD3AIF9_9AGAR|nr:hypothetical protein BDN72DRAFT_845810 [Pluteus cervinus]
MPESSPRLPPELEHTIFVLAVEDDVQEAKNLLLIAKRVFDWLIPHVFKVVQFKADYYLPIAFNESVYRKYGHHVPSSLTSLIWCSGPIMLLPTSPPCASFL